MATIQLIDVIRARRQSPTLLTEAFSSNKLQNAVSSIKSVLERKLGIVLYPGGGAEQYICRYGSFFGVRFFIGTTTQAIRFNFEQNGKSNEIVSVDVWHPTQGKFPVANIPTKGVSIANIIPLIIDTIKSPAESIGKSVEPTALSEAVEVDGQTYNSKAEAITTLLQQGYSPKEVTDLTGANASQVYGIKKKLSATSGEPAQQFAKVRAGSEEQSTDPEIVQGNKALAAQQYADPETIFDDLQDLIDLVISGSQPSLMIVGMPGIGKTKIVTDRINEKLPEEGWKAVKGFSTPFGLYQTLFQNRQKLIVFDDCDSIFRDPNARNILKAALDSYDKRTVSWVSRSTFNADGMTPEEIDVRADEEDRLPNEFEFEGQVIFISNLGKNQIEPAIMSRTMAIDITLKASDVFLRMETIIDKLAPSIKQSYKRDALDHLKQNHDKLGKQANIRTLINASRMRAGGSPNWKRLVERYS